MAIKPSESPPHASFAIRFKLGHFTIDRDEQFVRGTNREASRQKAVGHCARRRGACYLTRWEALSLSQRMRAIRHLLRLRGGMEGDPEMRLVAAALLDTLRPEAPALFAEFVISLCLP
jgi:hypothetical protein